MKTGRPPKPASQRVNRNKPTHETVVLPAAGRPGPAPEPMVTLTHEAARLWDRLWASPEATQWGEADVPGLSRMVTLQTDVELWRDAKIVGEMRNLEDRYGCNPYSRRVSKWVKDEDPDEQTKAEPASPPVRRLRAVAATGT